MTTCNESLMTIYNLFQTKIELGLIIKLKYMFKCSLFFLLNKIKIIHGLFD